MKKITIIFMLAFSFNLMANEIYKCDFFGPNYDLIIDEEGNISLQNNSIRYECSKYFEPFPGTEVDLTKIQCKSGSKKLDFYFTQYSENEIILSKNLVLSRDISCKK